jgi:hypothetical protein
MVTTRTKFRSPSLVAPIDATLSAVRVCSRSAWLDLARRDQCERWRSGNHTRAETYFDLLPELRADREDMLVLIGGEIQLRTEVGDSFTLHEYQHRFPDLAADIAMQYHIDRFLPPGAGLIDAEAAPADVPGWQLSGDEILP